MAINTKRDYEVTGTAGGRDQAIKPADTSGKQLLNKGDEFLVEYEGVKEIMKKVPDEQGDRFTVFVFKLLDDVTYNDQVLKKGSKVNFSGKFFENIQEWLEENKGDSLLIIYKGLEMTQQKRKFHNWVAHQVDLKGFKQASEASDSMADDDDIL